MHTLCSHCCSSMRLVCAADIPIVRVAVQAAPGPLYGRMLCPGLLYCLACKASCMHHSTAQRTPGPRDPHLSDRCHTAAHTAGHARMRASCRSSWLLSGFFLRSILVLHGAGQRACMPTGAHLHVSRRCPPCLSEALLSDVHLAPAWCSAPSSRAELRLEPCISMEPIPNAAFMQTCSPRRHSTGWRGLRPHSRACSCPVDRVQALAGAPSS